MNKYLNILAQILIAVLISCQPASARQSSGLLPLPYLVSACGGSLQSGNEGFDFSLGELLIETVTGSGEQYTQGYLQPEVAAKSQPGTGPEDCTLPSQLNNVLSPNGDGKNDRLQFRCLDHFPDNRISIFDRAGRRVYQTSPYRNDWTGQLGGRPLDEGTYFYILDAGRNQGRIMGAVSIIREQL